MRVKEEFKKLGYFWLPSVPEKKIPGTLTISDGGDIELEVVGSFDESIEGIKKIFKHDYELGRIVGHIENYGLVTLDHCLYKKPNVLSGGISKSLVFAHKALLGVAYDDEEVFLFNTFRFSVEGIDEWVGLSGINFKDNPKKRTARISYSPPKEILLNLNNGMNLVITFSWTLPDFPHETEAKITQKTYFKLVSSQERPLDDFISTAYKLTTFLCFAIDKTVCIEQVTLTSKTIRQKIRKRKFRSILIYLYYPSLPCTDDEPKIYRHQMLFRYGQIREDAERIINNWIGAYDIIEPALNLYFSTKTGAQKYLSGKFLALAQGLETYHRRTLNEKLMEEDVFSKLVETIINQCPEECRNWLLGRLQHGNEVNLGRRIKSIIEPFKELIGTKDQRKKLIRSIVDTRNYLTHFDQSLASTAERGEGLWALCLKVEAIFQLHFLQVLGFTEDEIRSLFNESQQLQLKLK